MRGDFAIGFDVGGTNLKAVAVRPSGEQVRERTVAIGPEGRAVWEPAIREIVDRWETEMGPARGVGIAAPGLVVPDGSAVTWMVGPRADLVGLDWEALLERPHPVPVLNDGQAALWGEQWRGSARGCDNVVMLTLGTGVGGAAIVDGVLLRGAIGRAGHFGHVCLDLDGEPDIVRTPGSLELAIGDGTVAQRSRGRFASTRDLVAAHLSGDAEATRVWIRSVRALGCALTSLINVLDPELVVLGGGVAQAGDALFVPLREVLDEVEWRPHGVKVRLTAATLGDLAGALGAARRAMEQMT